jgi:nucleoside-diphosphate-sugar epimerase
MVVAVAGGHGKIALRLSRLLSAEGESVIGLIRDPAQGDDLRDAGAEPVVCDLEGDDDVAAAIGGADAVVFAAGAGPGSGESRKRTMDLGGALKLIDAAKQRGVKRYLMVSAMGAADPPAEGGEVFGTYLRAKAEADRALRESGLDFTIVRPGMLTDEPGTGRVALGERVESGSISRDDVAAILVAVLREPATIGATFDAIAGETPVAEAVASVSRSP